MTGGMMLIGAQLLYFSRLGATQTSGTAAGASPRRHRDGADDDAEHGGGDARVPVDKAGVGSAVLNAFRQVGGSVGIALMGAIMAEGERAPGVDAS